MTVYYHLTFLLLASEMVTFCVLVFPLPYGVRKRILRGLAGNFIVAKVAYALKISFIFVAILFVDAVQRMLRIDAELQASRTNPQPVHDARAESNVAARKFYAQRNVYLTGFCLFLSLVLTRTLQIMHNLVDVQEENSKLKKQVAAQGSPDENVEALKARVKELEAKERDFQTLKKQAKQQAGEYDRLATELNKATGSVSDKRRD
ncbi:endoplasmic reticulum protein [Pluteus cervinus]|uniref:Endoplasmic reticulum protein n=1 Tax=Pluteus cervinus TaxID=181527 RepID=A0ACD3B2W3_9AGAR|nr:endoplasmic reticulum protein [Pluteus cervinus]